MWSEVSICTVRTNWLEPNHVLSHVSVKDMVWILTWPFSFSLLSSGALGSLDHGDDGARGIPSIRVVLKTFLAVGGEVETSKAIRVVVEMSTAMKVEVET